MKTFVVNYTGISSRFKNFSQLVNAESKSEAVTKIYRKFMDENYFPQENGSILDCDGYEIFKNGDEEIKYDGGYFVANDLTFDVIFNNDENSNNKGFKESFNYCKEYIDTNNGTKNSYFSDYKNGIVSIVCNETEEVVYEEEMK